MKIIFDSVEQRDKFIDIFCPSAFDLKEHKNCGKGLENTCKECWEQCGLDYEIKNNQSVQKETTLNLNDIIRVKFTNYAKDIYYHQHDNLFYSGALIIRDYPKVDINGYTDIQLWDFMRIFGPHIKFGMPDQIIENNNIYIKEESIKMFTYTDWVYELIKEECKGMDSIYEDYIIKLVGQHGLITLKRANLIESCGVLNCRRLYVLCDKPNNN